MPSTSLETFRIHFAGSFPDRGKLMRHLIQSLASFASGAIQWHSSFTIAMT